MKILNVSLLIASIVLFAGASAQAEDYLLARSKSRITTSRGGGDGVRNLRILPTTLTEVSSDLGFDSQNCVSVERAVTVCEEKSGRDRLRALPNSPKHQKQADELQQKIDRRECRIERDHEGSDGRATQLICESSN